MAILNETVAVTNMTIKSLPQRIWVALVTLIAIAIVVMVTMAFLAMAAGFDKTVAGSGADDIGIIMRAGSQAELNSGLSSEQTNLLAEAPGVIRPGDQPLASPELYVIVDGIKKTTGLSVNLPLRGMNPIGLDLRDGVTITQGRMFETGKNEIVVGRAANAQFAGFEVGDTVQFGKTTWQVVGHFEMNGSVFESELWADAKVVQSMYNRGNSYQSVRVRLDGPGAIQQIEDYANTDPRLNISVQTEADYFSQISKPLVTFINGVGYPLAIVMALGALAGALNAMYTSVSARQREIVTLRAIGFGGFSTFVGIMVEAMLLAIAGTVLGVLAAYVFFDGLTVSTLGQTFTQIVFDFNVSLELVVQAGVLALAIGLVGGFFPALRAARLPVVDAFRAV